MSILWSIVFATLVAGVGSVLLAAWLSRHWYRRYTDIMLSFAAGALLGTALLHLMPEAMESGVKPHVLFQVFMASLVVFFVLDKAELWHHGHEHHKSHDSGKAHAVQNNDHSHIAKGGWAVLLGDSMHVLTDGVLIAAAFLANPLLGWLATLAVFSHETPHHMGDLTVLRHTSRNERSALIKVSVCGGFTVMGGILGYALLETMQSLLPYLVMFAASSFVYVALADLIPQLQKKSGVMGAFSQLGGLIFGAGLVMTATGLVHREATHAFGIPHESMVYSFFINT